MIFLVPCGLYFQEYTLINEEIIPCQIFQKAQSLCSDVDEKDTPFVAMSLFLDAPLITGDKKLIKGLKEKGFEKIITLKSVLKPNNGNSK